MELHGRKVVDVQVEGVDSKDYPDFCDAYFSYAVFQDTGEPLDDDDMDLLNEVYTDIINEMAYDSLH
jgi:hypothetical protein